VRREVWRAVAIAVASAVAGLAIGSLVLYVVVLRRRKGG
jgi:ABC-type Fe3+ transport system permease subunit